MPDSETNLEKEDVRKILRALANNLPSVLNEMHIGHAGQKLARKRTGVEEPGGFLRMGGPLVSKHLDIFACKLGLAMHWASTGNIIPPMGGVAIRVYSNVEAMEGKLPVGLLRLLPAPQTLRQGSWDVENQFQYSIRITDDQTMGLFYATFRRSFGIAAVTAMDRRLFEKRIDPVFSPAEPWKH